MAKFEYEDFGRYFLIVDKVRNICFKIERERFMEYGEEGMESIIKSILENRQRLGIHLNNENRMNSLYLFVTNACNLHCKFCSMRSDNQEVVKRNLSTEQNMDGLLKLIKDAEPRKIIVSGGEPFITKDIFQILKEIRTTTRSKLIIQTNGHLLNTEKIEKLKEMVDSVEISTSHYDNFAELEEKVKAIADLGIKIALSFIYEDDKDLDRMKMITDLAVKYDTEILLHFIDLNGSAIDNDCKILSYKERLDVYRSFIEYVLEKGYINEKILSGFFSATKPSQPCSAYGKMAAVYPDGNVYICHSMVDEKYKLCNLNECFDIKDKMKEVLKKKEVKDLFILENNKKCKQCKFRLICGGECPMLVAKDEHSDCTLRKIMFCYNVFVFDKQVSPRENLQNFIKFCEQEQYKEYM